MSSGQERRPAGAAGTTDPTGSNAASNAGDVASRGASSSTGTGTSGYQHVGAHRGSDYQETAEWEGAAGSPARAGGIMLAAVLMIFTGLVTFFYGIVGIIHSAFYTATPNYIFYFGPRGRGIVDLVLGAVIFAAGVCILLGMRWARIVGITLAVLSAVFNFLILPWYPVWSVIVIALDVFIIWALATGWHDRRFARH
jgi:hypothetical protein